MRVEVDEAARIEAPASGGRELASKAITQRLDEADAAALGIDANRIADRQLAELATAGPAELPG